jgi:hypothetical protein
MSVCGASMSLKSPQKSDQQIIRLLQIGIVLEEIIEARAAERAPRAADVDEQGRALLEESASEAARHGERIERAVERLDANRTSLDDVATLVADQYEADRDFENPLYELLCNAETAFKHYDDLVTTIDGLHADAAGGPERLRPVLEDLRREKAQRVRQITELMDTQT